MKILRIFTVKGRGTACGGEVLFTPSPLAWKERRAGR
jgi:hypothetical protein